MKKTLRRVVAVLMIAAFLLTMIPDLGIISSDVYGATTYGTTTGLVKENGRWIFVRNGKGATLTPAGQQFVTYLSIMRSLHS